MAVVASDKEGKGEFFAVVRLSTGRCLIEARMGLIRRVFTRHLGIKLIRAFQRSASNSWVHEVEVAITFRRRKIKGKPDCGNCIDDQR